MTSVKANAGDIPTVWRIARKAAWAAISLCGATAGLLIAVRYPLAKPLAAFVFAGWVAIAFRWRALWLCVVPAVLPVLGFASWTGWLLVEEFDLLLFGVVAAGYARLALGEGAEARGKAGAPPHHSMHWAIRMLVALFLAWTVIALVRGFADAGGLRLTDSAVLGLYDYEGALNSLRIAKSYLWVAILLPLYLNELQREPRTVNRLAIGLAAGLALASASVVWERLAFAGLLNFSTDYRATGMFWEMHVGGAALDGFLALTLPFALWQALAARTRVQQAVAALIVALGGYACLVTFSRGLYGALAVSLPLLAVLRYRQRPVVLPGDFLRATIKWTLVALIVALTVHFVFRHGGYRALLAVVGIAFLILIIEDVWGQLTTGHYLLTTIGGAIAGTFVGTVAGDVPKGPYLFYAFVWTACLVSTLLARAGRRGWTVAAVVSLGMSFPLAANVAQWWGGRLAFLDCALVVAVLYACNVVVRVSGRRIAGDSLNARFAAMAGLIVVSVIVVAFSAGDYMSGRFAGSHNDVEGRIAHWRDGLSLLRGSREWLLGKGLGRFPAAYYYGVPGNKFPGGFRFKEGNAGNAYVTLIGPNHILGFGELFRFAQRIQVTSHDTYAVALDVRAPQEVMLHVEICEQHLLYDDGCAISEPKINPTGSHWRRIVVTMNGNKLGGGPWYAPRLAFFSLALETNVRALDIDNISVVGRDGHELIENGNFGRGTERWFFISDRYHLPWHIKSLVLNVLFDEGWIGLTLFALLVGSALARLAFTEARRNVLAPYLVSALTGFLAVGLFDSLLDVPRVAFVFYLLVIVSLTLSSPTTDHRAQRSATEPRTRHTSFTKRRNV